MKERQFQVFYIRSYYGFNPRSREGATSAGNTNFVEIVSFNPRSREGATFIDFGIYDLNDVSIHAPVKERHPPATVLLVLLFSFNPRSREGATIFKIFNWSGFRVSIHAPVKERLICSDPKSAI